MLDIVDRPLLPPGQCIASLKSEDPKGFIDTHITCPDIDPRVYVSVSWIEECARKLGFYNPEAGELAERLERRVAELEDEVRDADRFAEAAEYTLKKFGTRIVNKPGRKPAGKAA